MISTISIVTVGTIILVNTYLNPTTVKNENKLSNNELISDSSIIIQEHEKVVGDYLSRVETIKANFPLSLTVSGGSETTIKQLSIQLLGDTLKGRVSENESEIDTSYTFPKLNAVEQKAQKKQMVKMFGKARKRKNKGSWYQADPKGFLFIPMKDYENVENKRSIQAFYMKQTEVTNLEYRTFLFDLLNQGRKEDFLLAKPDQSRWVKDYPYSYNKPMEENYFSHPAYNDYPVVAMSRKGAELYCKWFTEGLEKVSGRKVNGVRLPTSDEWMHAAYGGHEEYIYPWCGKKSKDEKGSYLANFQPIKGNFKIDGGFFTVKVSSYKPNEYGLYCMSGNVAEMVYYVDENRKPGTMGGSWTSLPNEIKINGEDKYKGLIKASVDVGFRPVITFLGREYKKEITVTPPGTAKVNANFYVDKTEVTNFNWQEYLSWIVRNKGKSSMDYKNALPDTTVWTNDLENGNPYVKHYFSHPAYNNYPVVGVTYEQVLSFCKWRTDRVKELYELKKVKNKKDIYPINFTYRLPTKEEWERQANIGYSEKALKKLEDKYKGHKLANFKKGKGDNMSVPGNLNDNADVTAPVKSYWPNKMGCYNFIGNVAEMVGEKGIAKGGSWMHQKNEITIEKDFNYSKPACWIGFRCVMEVKD